jgi:hypothetical protein
MKTGPFLAIVKKLMSAPSVLLLGCALLGVAFFIEDGPGEFLEAAMCIGGFVLTMLMGSWAYHWVFAEMDRDFAKHDEYFTPRLGSADRQLQAFWRGYLPRSRAGAERRARTWGRSARGARRVGASKQVMAAGSSAP